MRSVMQLALVLVVLVLAAACAEEDVADDPPPDEPTEPEADPEEPTPDDPADEEPARGEETITGVLSGDPDLEGGCVWLETDDGAFEVVWPEGYVADAGEVVLRDDDGEVVAEAGDQLTVTGAVNEDLASICMVGTMFEATDLEAGA